MNSIKNIILVAATVLATSSAFAAKPTSIKYIEDIVMEGDQIYSHYVVKCSNGQDKDISAWDNRKNWCAGKGTKTDCNKKQIKTAKAVCKD